MQRVFSFTRCLPRAGGVAGKGDATLPGQLAQPQGFSHVTRSSGATQVRPAREGAARGMSNLGWLGGGSSWLGSGMLRTCLLLALPQIHQCSAAAEEKTLRSELEEVRYQHVLQTVKAKCCLSEGKGLDLPLLGTNALLHSFVATDQLIPIGQLGTLGGAGSGRDIEV